MKTNLMMNFSVDKENKSIHVQRAFAAGLTTVWSAWTESAILDKWWAPKPWVAKTKTMDFSEGGRWLYAMQGPEGEEHWSFMDYKSIVPRKSYSSLDGFCDELGKVNDSAPTSVWTSEFAETGDTTTVTITLQYDQLSDLEAIIEMGFKEGFLAAMDNLDDLLE
jgi:uncharacterized protein YndB with AHSA1/START domain